ncbi:MAG: aminotransferase class V-fold PLP-dependent enzyme, partial [Clostridia bacterium]|nr:aminotransferase class V-fold PLP-dependent enzyme [Clostridia bacterium]
IKMRESVAKNIGAKNANEVYFTASGCEADNWAIKGYAFANKRKGNHIITTKIEHHAILGACEFLEKHGFEVTYLDVDEFGVVSPEAVESAIKENTILISVMMANNEIGTVEPIKEIAGVAKKHKVAFHTDAVQAIGHVPVNVTELGVDMLSLSAHKFHGPKGVGMLYIKNGTRIDNLIHGGGQERGKRAATENLAGIAGLAKALDIAVADIDKNMAHMKEMRDRLINGIRDRIDYIKLNGPTDERRLCNNVNFSYEFVEGEAILMRLNMKGICASSGSACASGSLDPSHVLLAIGVPHEIAHGSIRFSVSEDTTIEEVDYVLEEMPKIITGLRNMSPMYEAFEEGKLESFTKKV